MPDGNLTPEPPSAPIGRVRLAEEHTLAPPGTIPDDSSASGWSAPGVGVALLVLLVMIGALAIILWGVFRTGL